VDAIDHSVPPDDALWSENHHFHQGRQELHETSHRARVHLDFNEEARCIRGMTPGLSIAASQFERLIATCRDLEREAAAATLVQLTLKSQ
jgi:hypothetical protein